MFHFYVHGENPAFSQPETYIAVIPAQMADKESLLAALGEALRFPAYFGKNYDAAWDCLRLLDGIDCKDVVLLHRDLPPLALREVAAYVALLRDAVVYWSECGDERSFAVWFPVECEKTIASLVGCNPGAEEQPHSEKEANNQRQT